MESPVRAIARSMPCLIPESGSTLFPKPDLSSGRSDHGVVVLLPEIGTPTTVDQAFGLAISCCRPKFLVVGRLKDEPAHTALESGTVYSVIVGWGGAAESTLSAHEG